MRQQLENHCLVCQVITKSKGDFCSGECALKYNKEAERQEKIEKRFTVNQKKMLAHTKIMDEVYVI